MELVDAGLIAPVKSGRTIDGKWYDLYRSLMVRINVSFDNGNININTTVDNHMPEKYTRVWTENLQLELYPKSLRHRPIRVKS